MHSIIHYSGEIGSKGQNRKSFENKLKDNIRSSLKREEYETIKIMNSRVVIKDYKPISDKLRYISGISFYAKAFIVNPDLKDISEFIKKRFGTDFSVYVHSHDKKFENTAKYVRENFGEKSSSGKIVFVEFLDDGCYIYDRKEHGIGGLPVGCTGKLISLLSGGIDSPVASWKMYRRGCSIAYVHFYNQTIVSPGVRRKIDELARVLAKYQFKTKLYIVPFGEIQKAIITHVPGDVEEGAKGFVSGDSLSQVASQTLENLKVIYSASSYPVFAPLIGEDKDSIIRLAKDIGTFDISIQPYNDCCSFFVAEHPKTKSEVSEIEQIEKRYDEKKLINSALESIEKKVFM
jgi:thiamine biosynthesis protein ThiI